MQPMCDLLDTVNIYWFWHTNYETATHRRHMERRIFTTNTNDPAVKLARVTHSISVVLHTRTSHSVCFPFTEPALCTNAGPWGDIHRQKVCWIRIADYTFNITYSSAARNKEASVLFICCVVFPLYILYCLVSFSSLFFFVFISCCVQCVVLISKC